MWAEVYPTWVDARTVRQDFIIMTATIIANMGPIDGSIPTAVKVFIIGSTMLDVSCMDSPITMASKGRNIMIPTPSDKAANNINEIVITFRTG